jgi:hypothetical protein
MGVVDEPEFRFRGERTYLHSSTIFDYLLAQDPNPVGVDFAFHKMTGRQCRVHDGPGEGLQDFLVATYRSDGLERYLYEGGDGIRSKYPCNESSIAERTHLEGPSAAFPMPPVEGASFIESVVGAYKKLLLALYADLPGKLLFVRVTLDHVPGEGSCGVVHHRKIGQDYFQSRLLHEQQQLGSLIFALK